MLRNQLPEAFVGSKQRGFHVVFQRELSVSHAPPPCVQGWVPYHEVAGIDLGQAHPTTIGRVSRHLGVTPSKRNRNVPDFGSTEVSPCPRYTPVSAVRCRFQRISASSRGCW